MVGKDKRIPASHYVITITFIMIGIIATGIFSVFTSVLNQSHAAMFAASIEHSARRSEKYNS
jgi:hypothetical protein